MTRTAFLAALEQLLAPLPEAERKDALSYYEDYLDAAGPENEARAIAELGSPEEVARKILDEQTPAGSSAAPASPAPRSRWRMVLGGGLAVLVLAYAGCCVAAGVLYSHVAFPGTSVLGMDVSRMSTQQVEKLWKEQGDALLDGTTFSLTRDGQEIGSVSLSQLGVTVLPLYVSQAAGCDVQARGWGGQVTSFLWGGWRFIESWCKGVDVTPQLDMDETTLTAQCESIADTVGCTVVDGGYRLADAFYR